MKLYRCKKSFVHNQNALKLDTVVSEGQLFYLENEHQLPLKAVQSGCFEEIKPTNPMFKISTFIKAVDV